MKEKRKLRLIRTTEGEEIRTITTYRKFRKRLILEGLEFYIYDRKRRTYQETLKEIPEEEYKEQEHKFEPPEHRIRRQVTVNYVDRKQSETGLIFLSIRALTINPDYEEDGLKMAVEEQKRILEQQAGIKLSEYTYYYNGLEIEEIAKGEDNILNDGRIHIEIFYNGEVQSTYVY